jgi:hypothetical protein
VWGHPAEVLLDALTGQNVTSEPFRMRFVSIGSMAGANISLPSAALRSSGLEIYGSGGGSVAPKAIFETFPKLWALAAGGGLHIDTEQVPLAEIENAWQRQDGNGRRLVIVP